MEWPPLLRPLSVDLPLLLARVAGSEKAASDYKRWKKIWVWSLVIAFLPTLHTRNVTTIVGLSTVVWRYFLSTTVADIYSLVFRTVLQYTVFSGSCRTCAVFAPLADSCLLWVGQSHLIESALSLPCPIVSSGRVTPEHPLHIRVFRICW